MTSSSSDSTHKKRKIEEEVEKAVVDIIEWSKERAKQEEKQKKDRFQRFQALWTTADQTKNKEKYVVFVFPSFGVNEVTIYKLPVPVFCKRFTVDDCMPHVEDDEEDFYDTLESQVRDWTTPAEQSDFLMSIRPDETAYILHCCEQAYNYQFYDFYPSHKE